MNRIGTTQSGGAIVEISRAELATLQQAGDLLSEIAACVLIDQPASVIAEKATPIARKPVKVSILPARGQINCTVCGVSKPASDFYDKEKRCKRCVLDRQKALKLANAGKGDQRAARKAAGLAVVEKVQAKIKAGGTFLARERDPALDRPMAGGRTLPVGGEV